MSGKIIKRITAAELKVHLGEIVQDVALTQSPVIVQTQGQDQVVIISLRDFTRLGFAEEGGPVTERGRVRAALREAGLFSDPTAQEVAEVQAFETRYPPQDQEHILAEWRRLEIEPPLSEIILRNRD